MTSFTHDSVPTPRNPRPLLSSPSDQSTAGGHIFPHALACGCVGASKDLHFTRGRRSFSWGLHGIWATLIIREHVEPRNYKENIISTQYRLGKNVSIFLLGPLRQDVVNRATKNLEWSMPPSHGSHKGNGLSWFILASTAWSPHETKIPKRFDLSLYWLPFLVGNMDTPSGPRRLRSQLDRVW